MAGLIREVRGIRPKLGEKVFVAETAVVIGDVVLEDEVSVWYNVVLRGDVHSIRVGAKTNIQDGTVVHATFEKFSTWIGPGVTIGHSCLIHGCQIEEGALIGMGSIIMDGAQIGEWSLVGAGSLVTEGKIFPPRSLILGRPAKVCRTLTSEELDQLKKSRDHYLLYKSWYEEGI